jgi:hypothetical protein
MKSVSFCLVLSREKNYGIRLTAFFTGACRVRDRKDAKKPGAALCRNQTLRNLRTENFTGMDRMNRISL